NTNGHQYVSAATTFTLTGTQDHFWDTDELTMFGSVTDPFSVVTAIPPAHGSITAGRLNGSEGGSIIYFHAEFVECSIDESPSNKAHFFLDRSPPFIDITSPLPLPPSTGKILDVVSTSTLNYTTFDSGSGVATEGATLDGKPISNGATLDAFFLDAGDHTVIVSASDKVGNATTKTDIFSVHATTAGLLAAVDKG